MKIFCHLSAVLIHFRTAVLSVQQKQLSINNRCSFNMILASRAPLETACSSKLGTVLRSSGVALFLPMMKRI